MRINKYLASCGVASRRKVDAMIKEGRVTVNGVRLTEPGIDVTEQDEILVDGRRIEGNEKKVYYLLNKPKGYVTTVSDEQGRATVLDLIHEDAGRLFPVGRLDANTSGLLIITNDGELFHHLMHPSHHIDKTYRALVQGFFTLAKAERLSKGIDLGDFRTAPAKVTVIKQGKNSSVVDITIHEGKNRQVRRMFKAMGHPVIELERTRLGPLVIGRLAAGSYRKLSPAEVQALFSRRR